MRRLFSLIALAIILCLVASAVYLSRSHRSLIDSKPPPTGYRPYTPMTARPALVWVLVDGLGYRDFPTLSIAEHEYIGILESESPTKSIPNVFAQLTGTRPHTNGVVSNSGKTIGIGLGPLFQALGRGSPISRMGTVFDEFNGSVSLIMPNKSGVVEKLLVSLAPRGRLTRYTGDTATAVIADTADFTTVYLSEVDHAGHAGPRHSAAFVQAVARTTQFIAELRASNLSFILTSDHGVLDGGGHGGPEANAKRGVVFLSLPGSTIASPPSKHGAIDVASTLAVLLGCNAPRHNQGSPIRGSPMGSLHPSGILNPTEAPTLDALVFTTAIIAASLSTVILRHWPETRKPALFVVLYYAAAVAFFLLYFGVIDRVDEEFRWGFSQLGAYVSGISNARLIVTAVGPAVFTPPVVFFVDSVRSRIALVAWTIDALLFISIALVYNVSGDYNDLDAQSAYRAEHLFLMSIPLMCVSSGILFCRRSIN